MLSPKPRKKGQWRHLIRGAFWKFKNQWRFLFWPLTSYCCPNIWSLSRDQLPLNQKGAPLQAKELQTFDKNMGGPNFVHFSWDVEKWSGFSKNALKFNSRPKNNLKFSWTFLRQCLYSALCPYNLLVGNFFLLFEISENLTEDPDSPCSFSTTGPRRPGRTGEAQFKGTLPYYLMTAGEGCAKSGINC